MDKFREYGKTGLYRFNTGWIYEEFLRELQGRRGVEVYKEMSENDDVIGAILFATEMLMRQTTWSIQEAGTAEVDMDAAEFVRTCMDDMEETWSDFISEVLSFLTFGGATTRSSTSGAWATQRTRKQRANIRTG